MGGATAGYAPHGVGGADARLAGRRRKWDEKDIPRLHLTITDPRIRSGTFPTDIDANIQGCHLRRAEGDVLAAELPAAD